MAERLQVEGHDVGRGIVEPVLEQIGGGHVGPVAGGDQHRDADAAVDGPRQDVGTQRPALREEADAAAGRELPHERAVEGHRGVGVHDAHAGRAHDAHPVPACRGHELVLSGAPCCAGLGETAGEDDQCVHPLGGALRDRLRDDVRRRGDEGDVHRSGDVGDAAIGPHAGDRGRRRVDREGGPGELRRDDPARDLVARGAGLPAGADDGDGPGASIRATDRAWAVCSRARNTSRERGVGVRLMRRRTEPLSNSASTSNPASRKTPVIALLPGRTSAVNRRTPDSRAMAARCSSTMEPRPRPWCASSIRNATSASSPAPDRRSTRHR